jgi:hypothetical protein
MCPATTPAPLCPKLVPLAALLGLVPVTGEEVPCPGAGVIGIVAGPPWPLLEPELGGVSPGRPLPSPPLGIDPVPVPVPLVPDPVPVEVPELGAVVAGTEGVPVWPALPLPIETSTWRPPGLELTGAPAEPGWAPLEPEPVDPVAVPAPFAAEPVEAAAEPAAAVLEPPAAWLPEA